MRIEDKPKFASLLFGWITEYYQRDLSDTLMSIYWDGLENYSYQDVKGAFDAHAKNPENGQFPPKISDLSKIIDGNSDGKAQAALAKLESAFGACGAYRIPVFDDANIHRAIAENGGWLAFCHCEEKAYPFLRNDFVKSYKARLNRSESYSEAIPQLTNIQGFPPTQVFIGDRKKCETVLLAITGNANDQKQLEHKGGI